MMISCYLRGLVKMNTEIDIARIRKDTLRNLIKMISYKQSNDRALHRKEKVVLHLTLKKKWFDMIKSGIKKEEYRETKPYWSKRLFTKAFTHVCFTNGYGHEMPSLLIELKSIDSRLGLTMWGAPPEELVYCLNLGNIVWYSKFNGFCQVVTINAPQEQ